MSSHQSHSTRAQLNSDNLAVDMQQRNFQYLSFRRLTRGYYAHRYSFRRLQLILAHPTCGAPPVHLVNYRTWGADTVSRADIDYRAQVAELAQEYALAYDELGGRSFCHLYRVALWWQSDNYHRPTLGAPGAHLLTPE